MFIARHLGTLACIILSSMAGLSYAQNWGEIPVISATMDINAQRLCIGNAARELGCPAYAPSVTTAGDISVTGNVSANRFIGAHTGDGSGLTNISASNIAGLSTDRIVSTSANIVAGNGGTISFTTGGVSGTAYFGTTGQLVLPTISTTGAISATVGYFRDRLAVGAPTTNGWDFLVSTTNGGSFGVNAPDGGLELASGNDRASYIDFKGFNNLSSDFIGRIWYGDGIGMTLSTSGTVRVIISESGNVGIGIVNPFITPSTTLHVSGTLRLANGGEACDTNRAGAIRYSGTDFQVCYGTGGWASLVDASGTTVTPDRITSGTTDVRARADGSISFTTAGTTTGYFYNGQLVANRISTTGAISATSIYAGNIGGSGSLIFRDQNGVLSALNGNAYFDTANTQLYSSHLGLMGGGGIIGFNSYYSNANNRWEYRANSEAAAIRLGQTSQGQGGDIQFITFTSNTLGAGAMAAGATRVNIANNGNVGIGISTMAPSSTLHVNGTARITSWTMVNANASATAPLEVSGTISATAFVGNGAGLTNLNAAAITGLSTDAITSGTTTMRVNSASSFISLTTGGVTWAYLGNAASFMPNVSATRMEVSATLNLRPQSVTTIVGSAGGGAGSSASSSLISSGTTSVATFTGTNSISLSTAGTTRMVVTSAGNVGIGTNTPGLRLDVSGSIAARAFDAGSGTSIDFTQSNVAHTSAACGSFTLSGIADGGSYSLFVKGSGTGPATFTHSGLTVKTTGTLTCTTAKHSAFSFVRAGTDLYVTMITGF